jgi:hypothetical protein
MVVLCAVMGLLMAFLVPASAAPITILNPSFESPSVAQGTNSWDAITNWTISSGDAGVWNPGPWYAIPYGSQVAWMNAGATISQTLGATIAPNSLYYLQAYVASGWYNASYTLQLVADNTVVAQITGQPPAQPFIFQQVGLLYQPSNQYIGDNLQINISAAGAALDVNKVTLNRYIEVPYILNPSFESPSVAQGTNSWDNITNWIITSGDAGVWNPGPWYTTIPAGNQIAWMHAGATICQFLGVKIKANTLYNLQAYFASGWYNASYTLQLVDAQDNVVLAQITGQPPAQPFIFQQEGLLYQSNSQYIGDNLEIRISAAGAALDVDEVTLTSIPIPSTLLLLGSGIAGMALMWRRRS